MLVVFSIVFVIAIAAVVAGALYSEDPPGRHRFDQRGPDAVQVANLHRSHFPQVYETGKR